MRSKQVHGTALLLNGAGVLLRGPPGAGKSDLALRLIEGGARLVADDRVDLVREGERLIAAAPARLAGLLEVRGVGIVAVAHATRAALRLVVDLVAPDEVSRLPEPRRCRYLGLTLPLIALAPFEASAPAKLRLAVAAAVEG
ncbi:MAG: HPr kinase/phosphatase C-terminal domain-containing protein [Proteobacteria bacterium]|nr:HPr kinase/phosphatase C-terminal domain-containing protein [Pseudomonadota bacterium]